MQDIDFQAAVKFTLGIEKGLNTNKADRGGLTNFGISSKSYPEEDIENLTVDRAIEIYRKDFWEAQVLDSIVYPLNILVFDFGVNSGIHTSSIYLQIILGAKRDGIIGPKTIKSLSEFLHDDKDNLKLTNLCYQYLLLRYNFIKNMGKNDKEYFNIFGLGLLDRIHKCYLFISKQL